MVDDITRQWIRCRADELAVANGCYFSQAHADRVLEFFSRFVRIRARGGTKKFEMLKWQWEQLTAPLFGWRRKDGKRRFKEAYISVAKKNGKTLWEAALALYMLIVEVGPGQECYSFATEREQAGMVYREAAKMVRASPALKKIITPIRTTKTLTFNEISSFFRSMSAEADSADGINAAFVAYDELHRAKNRELYDTLKYSGTAIEERTGEPQLMVCTTTAGHDRESICYEVYSYAKRVQTGEIPDDAFYTYIAEASPEDDWTKEETWYKANPSLGTGIMPLASFQRDFNEARNNPAGENRFRRLRLNQWTEQATRWIPLDLWDANGGAVDEAKLIGKECYGGLDLSSVGDTTASVYAFPNELGGYDLLPRIFVPEANLDARGRANGVSYGAWSKAGMLLTTPGNVIDPDAIFEDVKKQSERFLIKEIGFDRWKAVNVIPRLEGEGLVCVPIAQGFSLSSACTEFFRLLSGKKIRHGNHPVFRWQAGNVEAKTDKHENIRLEKPGGPASRLRIDSIVAAVMAVDRAMKRPVKQNSGGLCIGFA